MIEQSERKKAISTIFECIECADNSLSEGIRFEVEDDPAYEEAHDYFFKAQTDALVGICHALVLIEKQLNEMNVSRTPKIE